jgi:hypothetical protein
MKKNTGTEINIRADDAAVRLQHAGMHLFIIHIQLLFQSGGNTLIRNSRLNCRMKKVRPVCFDHLPVPC